MPQKLLRKNYVEEPKGINRTKQGIGQGILLKLNSLALPAKQGRKGALAGYGDRRRKSSQAGTHEFSHKTETGCGDRGRESSQAGTHECPSSTEVSYGVRT